MSKRRADELFGADRRVHRVEVRLTAFELERLDMIAEGRRLSRSAALREVIGWLAAKDAIWAELARKARVAKVIRDAEAWEPVSDHLAGGEPEATSLRP